MPQTSSSHQLTERLIQAGHALAAAGLVTAFGHISARTSHSRLLITPAEPLGGLSNESNFTELDVDSAELPAAVPREAWIHLAIALRRPDVGAICRAQPPIATALTSGQIPILALHGQAAFVGSPVPVFDDAVLIRDSDRAGQLADQLGESAAMVLRGNGAVTVGADLEQAVARMWVLEASAQMNQIASSGTPQQLSAHELTAWQRVAPEILSRIWRYISEKSL